MAIYCGNSALHISLKANGGNTTFGTHDQCFKKGYGIGYNAPVGEISKFMVEWGPYKPYIVQKNNLWRWQGPAWLSARNTESIHCKGLWARSRCQSKANVTDIVLITQAKTDATVATTDGYGCCASFSWRLIEDSCDDTCRRASFSFPQSSSFSLSVSVSPSMFIDALIMLKSSCISSLYCLTKYPDAKERTSSGWNPSLKL